MQSHPHEFTCPSCSASPGDPCTVDPGHAHESRWRMARAADWRQLDRSMPRMWGAERLLAEAARRGLTKLAG